MDADLDWCLTCEKRVQGDGLYCSPECQERAGPPSQDYFSNYTQYVGGRRTSYRPREPSPPPPPLPQPLPTESRWTGNDYAGIAAWAAEIPSGAPAGAEANSFDSSFRQQPTPRASTTYRQSPPNLLKSSRRTLPPTLSMASPQSVPPPPSHPLVTPKRQPSFSSIALTGNASMGQTSLRSAATESSLVSTPYSSQPVPIASVSRLPPAVDGIYSHVRSWVSPALQLPSTQKRIHPTLPRVDPSKLMSQAPSNLNSCVNVVSSPHSSYAVSEQSAILWTTGTFLVDQPTTHKQSLNKTLLGRKPTTDISFPHDDHPSFRTRGRKASRAAA